MIIVLIGALVWATISAALAIAGAYVIRIRGPYPEGESFNGWFRKLALYGTLGGWGLAFAAWTIGWMYRVQSGLIAAPAWLSAPMWLATHWYIIPGLFAAAAMVYAGWWKQNRGEANAQLEPDDTVELPPVVAPMWSINQDQSL